jgi:hypothetical protein
MGEPDVLLEDALQMRGRQRKPLAEPCERHRFVDRTADVMTNA